MFRFLRNGIVAMILAVPALVVGDPIEESDGLEAKTSSCLDAAIDAIQSRYEHVDALRANFAQTTRTAALAGEASRATGTVTFAKPGKMRWAYTDPPSLLVSDGETLWIYDPAFDEVQKMSVGSEYLSGASIQFLLGSGSIRRDFSIADRGCSADEVELGLTPIAPATYERLAILADPKTGDLLRTTIVDLFGNVTEVTFSNLEIDPKPTPETFRFDPPAGVKVLEIGTSQG